MTDVPPPRAAAAISLSPRYTGDQALIGALYSAHPDHLPAESVPTPTPTTAASIELSARPAQLSPRQILNATLAPLASGGSILTAPQGSFVLSSATPLPPQLAGAGEVLSVLIQHDGTPIGAEIIQAGGAAVRPPIAIDLNRLQPGARIEAKAVGQDPFGRLVFTSAIGAFALAPEDLRIAGQSAPQRATLLLSQAGSDIHGQVIGLDGAVLDHPLAVALARTPLNLPFDAIAAGTDRAGRTLLATPFGVFLVLPASQAGEQVSLGQLLAPADHGQKASEPSQVQLVLRTIGGRIGAEIIARDGHGLVIPIGVSLALAEGEGPPVAARAGKVVPGLGAAQIRAILTQLGTQWPALDQTITALRSLSPEVMQQVIARLPRPNGGKIMAQMLSLLHAIDQRSARQLLGEPAVSTLIRAGKGNLVHTLEDDLARLHQFAQHSSSDWRPVLMPFFDGAQVWQVPLAIGRPPEAEKDSPDPGTRFMVGIDFAHLGLLQFDGFVHVKDKRFDLTIRSDAPLDEALRDGARQRFLTAMAGSALSGRLFFQVGRPLPVPCLEGLDKLRHGS